MGADAGKADGGEVAAQGAQGGEGDDGEGACPDELAGAQAERRGFVFEEVILEQKSKITIAQRWILSEIKKNKEMTLKDLMKITEIKETTLKIYLSRLVQLGLIVSIRVSGEETIYTIKKGKKSNGKKES